MKVQLYNADLMTQWVLSIKFLLNKVGISYRIKYCTHLALLGNLKFIKYRIAVANCDHRETGTLDDTNYLFNELKLAGPFTIDDEAVTAVEYVRSKFLKMYQTDAQYFWTNGSMAWWKSVSGIDFDDSSDLLVWLNSQTYNSTWLDFIKVQ